MPEKLKLHLKKCIYRILRIRPPIIVAEEVGFY